jgi:hypothetical protein
MTLTVLASSYASKRLAKTITRKDDGWHVRDHDRVYFHDIVPADEVDDLEELSAVLIVLEAFPEACIIRGKLVSQDTEEIRRLSVDEDDTDTFFGGASAATFADQPLRWIMIDVDKMEADPTWTPAQRIAAIIAKLPPAFRGADFHFQWSSKAGLDGWRTISAHLWFWLSEPVTSADLKARAKDERWKEDHGVDIGLYQPVQIHYTAAPVYLGADDPLKGQRSQLIRLNRREVTLPPWAPKVEEYRPTGQMKPFEIVNPEMEARIAKWVEATVNHRCQAIVDALNGDQNVTIYKSAAKLGQLVVGGILDEQAAEKALLAAAAAGNHPKDRAETTVKQGLRRGMRYPIYGPPPFQR